MKTMRVKKTILKAVLLLTACGALADNLPASLRQGRLSAQSSATLGDIEPLLNDFFPTALAEPVAPADGGRRRSVVAPEKSAGEAQVPPPSPAEPGTRDYYERHIIGKYVMDGDALVGISGTDAGIGVRFRTAEWMEGSVLETHGTNLLVVGQVITNASGAVRTERGYVLSPLPDQPARTTNAWLRALAIRDGTYRYTTESGSTGTLSGWREVRGPTFEAYRRIYERDLEAAKKGDRIEIKGESQFEPLSRPRTMSYADRLRERTRPKTQAEHSTEEAMRQRITRLARETAAKEIARREAEAASNKIGQQTPVPLITPIRKAEAAAAPSVGTNGFYVYTLNSAGQASITGFDKAFVGELTVTHLLGGCPVTEIGKNAFAGCRGIKEVNLPASLVTIGDTAFNGCGNMVRLTISDSVKEIGVRAFQSCGKLEALTIPASVTTIKEAAFEYCHSLKTVFVPAGVTTLGGNPFGGCGHLQSVTVDPANPAYLSDAEGVVFNKHKTELVAVPATRTGEYPVPEGVTNILRGAFLLCKGLNSVQLPSSLKRLGGCAFFVCSNLRSVTLAEGVESIGMQAFESCSQLETITLPASVRHLESWAFRNASGLRSVRFLGDAPDGAGNTTLFHNCPEAVIYRNPEAKGWGETFGGQPVKIWSPANPPQPGMAQPDLAPSTPAQDSRTPQTKAPATAAPQDHFSFKKNNSTIDYSFAFIKTNGSATIIARGHPRQTKAPTIRPYPAGALVIPSILDGVPVAAIGDSAFYSFRTDSLVAVTIPASVVRLGDMAFGGCAGLRAVYFEGDAPNVHVRNSRYGLFTSVPDDCIVYVRPESTGWNGVAGSTTLPPTWQGKTIKTYTPEEKIETLRGLLPEIRTETIEGLTYSYTVSDGGATLIGDWSKTSTRNINNVDYPQRDRAVRNKPEGTLTIPSVIGGSPVIAIGKRAFNGCASLTAVVIPEGVESIGEEAFSGCRQLESVKLPDSLARIHAQAFWYCDKLNTIAIPRKTEQIGYGTFEFCTNLASITVAEGNAHLADVDGVLYDRAITNLIHCPYARREIVIPDSIVSIPEYRFQNYKALTSLVLSRSVATLTPEVFKGWTGLTSVTVPAESPHFMVHDGILYDKQMKTLIRCPPAREGEVIIPDGVENIANVAFENCVKLTRIVVPEGVKRLGGLSWGHVTGAFYNCERLTEITLPASLEYLGYCCFGRCRNLQRVFFRGNAPKSGGGAFWDTKTTVYYLAGAAGWGNEYDKRPTALWDPKKPLPPLDPPSISAEATRAQVAVTLKVGAPAPQLAQGKYVQGEPVAAFEKGKVYVVECWATWCGPCRTVIPHVNALQEKYREKGLVVIGQNVWQRGEDVEKDVAEFVKEMGADMTYRVALDRDGAMAESWMKAAGRGGIPSAFVVDREGKIAWIGHPSSGLDEAVEKALGDGAGE